MAEVKFAQNAAYALLSRSVFLAFKLLLVNLTTRVALA
jgi:hypothetical protein